MISKYKAVVIGGSAGGLEAMRRIFSSLGSDFICPLIVVQHVERSAKFDYSIIFCNTSGLIACEAEDKLRIENGHIYFAPPGYHLYIEDDCTFGLSVDPLVNWSRPSIDPTFESAARVYGEHLIAIILTGANADGAYGLKKVKEAGGITIVQDPRTAIADAMPNAAIATGKADYILPDDQIGPLLARLLQPAGEGQI